MSRLTLERLSIDGEKKRIVDDVSFSLASEEIHVLMGQNGSGKSTLVNGMMGHPKFTIAAGKLLLDDTDIIALPTERKAALGIFLSMQYLPEIPGVTLLNFLHRAHKAQTGSTVSVLDFYRELEATAKELGMDATFLKRQVGVGLSGGEKKQAEILQMIALKPKFALLDEIDSGVDVDALKIVERGIAYLQKQGTGFLLITHYDTLLREIAPNAVHVMKDGKIVRSGGEELAALIKQKGFAGII